MKDELKRTHASSNPLIKIFFRTKTNLAIKIACLKKSDIILDYGCGGGFLKNKLKSMGFNALGYDITPEHSDLEDYRELNPNKIFAIDVFEPPSKILYIFFKN